MKIDNENNVAVIASAGEEKQKDINQVPYLLFTIWKEKKPDCLFFFQTATTTKNWNNEIWHLFFFDKLMQQKNHNIQKGHTLETGTFSCFVITLERLGIQRITITRVAFNIGISIEVCLAFITLPASETFLTLTWTIKFITGFWQGANRITVTGIATCTSCKTPVIYLTAEMNWYTLE